MQPPQGRPVWRWRSAPGPGGCARGWARARSRSSAGWAAQASAAASEGALTAFDDVRLALSPKGEAQAVFGSAEALSALAPGLEGLAAAQGVVEVLTGLHTGRMEALVQAGEAFETLMETPQGAWAVEGRPHGGRPGCGCRA
ncbi:hypothetical protein V8F63_05135 [Brevundimonas sp. LF-1]|uniref:hypothetical protein n=1 Tax=Brevundimonas sp. LF-1 TaxID=3126100 RepID=UPI0030E131AC